MFTDLSTLRVSLFHWNHFKSRAASFASSGSEHCRPIKDVSSAKKRRLLTKNIRWVDHWYSWETEVDQVLNPGALHNLLSFSQTALHWYLLTGSDWRDSFWTNSHRIQIFHMIPFFFSKMLCFNVSNAFCWSRINVLTSDHFFLQNVFSECSAMASLVLCSYSKPNCLQKRNFSVWKKCTFWCELAFQKIYRWLGLKKLAYN